MNTNNQKKIIDKKPKKWDFCESVFSNDINKKASKKSSKKI